MGNECSCNKMSLSSLGTASLSPGKTNEKDKGEQRNECKSLVKRTETFTEAVKNNVDIDPREEDDETPVEKVKEYKVLPPIRKKANTLPKISHKPNRIWGGSVNSYLDTINRNSIIDEDIITGRKKRERRSSSLTLHSLRKASESGEVISWEKKITVLSEVDEPSTKIGEAASQFQKKFRADPGFHRLTDDSLCYRPE